MSNDRQAESLRGDGFWKLLADDEVGSVCAVETAARLSDGDEYCASTCGRLSEGVCRAEGAARPTGHVLPRKAVPKDTWSRIVAQLAALPIQHRGAFCGRTSPARGR